MITLSEDEIPKSVVETKREDWVVSGYSSGEAKAENLWTVRNIFKKPKQEDGGESR